MIILKYSSICSLRCFVSPYVSLNNKICISETKTKFKMPKKANIFESFSHSAIQQFKEAFGIMDTDKDGLLSSSDLVSAFAAHGKNVGGGEAQVKICWQGPKNVKTYINVREREGNGMRLSFVTVMATANTYLDMQDDSECMGICSWWSEKYFWKWWAFSLRF